MKLVIRRELLSAPRFRWGEGGNGRAVQLGTGPGCNRRTKMIPFPLDVLLYLYSQLNALM